jgi:hypothetical protein
VVFSGVRQEVSNTSFWNGLRNGRRNALETIVL